MNKAVMNAIEILSVKYNFPVDEAVLLFNKKEKKGKKATVENKTVDDLFAQLVNDSDERS